MTTDQLVKYVTGLLNDDEPLNDYIGAQMRKYHPDLDPLSDNFSEKDQDLYFSLVNSYMLTIVTQALGSMRVLDIE